MLFYIHIIGNSTQKKTFYFTFILQDKMQTRQLGAGWEDGQDCYNYKDQYDHKELPEQEHIGSAVSCN